MDTGDQIVIELRNVAAELRVFNELVITVVLAEARGPEEESAVTELQERLSTIRSRMGSSIPDLVAEPYEDLKFDLGDPGPIDD